MKILDLIKLSVQKITRNLRDTVITVLIFVIVFGVGVFVLNFDYFVAKNMANLSQFEEKTGYMVGQTDKFKPTFVIENYEPMVAMPDENVIFNKNFAETGISFVSDGLFEKYYSKPSDKYNIPVLLNNALPLAIFRKDVKTARELDIKKEKLSHYGFGAWRIILGQNNIREFAKPLPLKFVTNLPVDKFSENQAENQKFLKELQSYKYEFIETEYKLQIVNNIFLNVTEIANEDQNETTEPLQLQPLVARLSDKSKFGITSPPKSTVTVYDIGKYDGDYQYGLIKNGFNALGFPSQKISYRYEKFLIPLFQLSSFVSITLLVVLVIFLTFLYNKLNQKRYFVLHTQNLCFWDFVKLQAIYFGALTWISLCFGLAFAWAIYSQFSLPILINLAGMLFPMSDVLYFSSFGYFAPIIWQIVLLWIVILATILVVTSVKYKKICSI